MRRAISVSNSKRNCAASPSGNHLAMCGKIVGRPGACPDPRATFRQHALRRESCAAAREHRPDRADRQEAQRRHRTARVAARLRIGLVAAIVPWPKGVPGSWIRRYGNSSISLACQAVINDIWSSLTRPAPKRGKILTDNPRTRALLSHLATRPGHDEVKSDFRQLLVEEFGVELGALDFERRVPEVRGRLDALIGRTVFEAKRNLDQEWEDVVRRMPDYLADREREEGERFVGIASDGLKWVVFERRGDQLVKLKETILDPDKPDVFLAWLDGAVALRSALPPDPITVRMELGHGLGGVSPRQRRPWRDLGEREG